ANSNRVGSTLPKTTPAANASSSTTSVGRSQPARRVRRDGSTESRLGASKVRAGAAASAADGERSIDGAFSELLLDSQEAVVLRDAFAAAQRAGLDLSAADGDGEIGDRRVLGLARAVRHHLR